MLNIFNNIKLKLDQQNLKDQLLITKRNIDLRFSSLQCGLFSPADYSFTPESCRSLLLRSRCLRPEDCELRTEERAPQILSDSLHPLSLKKESEEQEDKTDDDHSCKNTEI